MNSMWSGLSNLELSLLKPKLNHDMCKFMLDLDKMSEKYNAFVGETGTDVELLASKIFDTPSGGLYIHHTVQKDLLPILWQSIMTWIKRSLLEKLSMGMIRRLMTKLLWKLLSTSGLKNIPWSRSSGSPGHHGGARFHSNLQRCFQTGIGFVAYALSQIWLQESYQTRSLALAGIS